MGLAVVVRQAYLVPMYQYVVCNEPGCPRQDEVRRVERPVVGDGMIAFLGVACECSPDREMRRVAAPAIDMDEVMVPLHQWVLDEGLVGSEPPC